MSGRTAEVDEQYRVTRGADYIIEEIVDGDEIEVIIFNTNYGLRESYKINSSKQDLNDIYNDLRKQYYNIVEHLGNPDFLNIIEDCYQKIADIGKGLYMDFIGSKNNNLLDKILARPKSKPGKIVIHGDKFLLPYEFITSKSNFSKASFLGSKYSLVRSYHLGNDKGSGDLPPKVVAFKINERLKNAKSKEVDTFQKLKKLGYISTIDLAEQANVLSTDFKSLVRSEKFDLLHLACHIRHFDDRMESHLDFGDEQISYRTIKKMTVFQEKIMIFINACRSGKNDLLRKDFTTLAFQKLVDEIVSVDIDVPDTLAGNVSKSFYNNIFLKGLIKEDALQKAALYEFDRKNDIGGFFYSYYRRENV